MIKILLLCTMIQGDIQVALPPEIKTEARKRDKQQRGRRRGGSGLR
tara:strand:+ start:603 stop:740 length:138 start_codon:yes stop_codon:yes gene_type:complete